MDKNKMKMTIEEVIEELNYCIGLIKQDGKDYIDDRDIPFLEMAINTIRKYQKIREIATAVEWEKEVSYQSVIAMLNIRKVIQEENDMLKEDT